ncbi:MAG: pyrimidine-nucleoside phosphorylase, partial [candidate division WOR-3 bacterium]
MTITAGQLNVSELIRRTRDGEALCAEEIDGFVSGFASGTVPDYQMAAWLMAVRLRSLSRDETVALTRALMRSGQVLDWSGIGRPTADKHSTGGVGDK